MRLDSQHRQGMFVFVTFSRLNLGPTQTPVQWVPEALISGVKWLGHEADHSFPSTIMVMNAWCYTFTLPYICMAWNLIKHRTCLHGIILG